MEFIFLLTLLYWHLLLRWWRSTSAVTKNVLYIFEVDDRSSLRPRSHYGEYHDDGDDNVYGNGQKLQSVEQRENCIYPVVVYWPFAADSALRSPWTTQEPSSWHFIWHHLVCTLCMFLFSLVDHIHWLSFLYNGVQFVANFLLVVFFRPVELLRDVHVKASSR